MDANQRKQIVMDATMRVVAEKGLESFAVLQAAKLAQVNEALVYRDFGTKENLLFECYNTVAEEVAELYRDVKPIDFSDTQATYTQAHDIWYTYFAFLVQNGYKTVFYQQYRDSNHIHTYMEKEAEGKTADFTPFLSALQPLLASVELTNGLTHDHVWTYLMDTSTIFAKRIIRGQLENTPESYEAIWNMLAFGIKGMLQMAKEKK